MINYKKEFEKFLNEHEALEEFYNYSDLSPLETIYDETAIRHAFICSSTPEGSGYWTNLSDLWNVRLEALGHPF